MKLSKCTEKRIKETAVDYFVHGIQKAKHIDIDDLKIIDVKTHPLYTGNDNFPFEDELIEVTCLYREYLIIGKGDIWSYKKLGRKNIK